MPDTDIWTSPITGLKPSGFILLAGGATYQNQPYFIPEEYCDDGAKYHLLFTQIREDGSTDIFTDCGGELVPLFESSTSEYSPTLSSDHEWVYFVRVEADSTQRLWRRRLRDGLEAPVFPEIKGVGYYTQLTQDLFALFIVGEPHTLVLADVRSQLVRKIDDDIQPGITRVRKDIGPTFTEKQIKPILQRTVLPDTSAEVNARFWPSVWADIADETMVSYVKKGPGGKYWLWLYEVEDDLRYRIGVLPGTEPHHTWTASGIMLAVGNGKLYSCNPGALKRSWVPLPMKKPKNMGSIYRVALSADDTRIAVVTYTGKHP